MRMDKAHKEILDTLFEPCMKKIAVIPRFALPGNLEKSLQIYARLDRKYAIKFQYRDKYCVRTATLNAIGAFHDNAAVCIMLKILSIPLET